MIAEARIIRLRREEKTGTGEMIQSDPEYIAGNVGASAGLLYPIRAGGNNRTDGRYIPTTKYLVWG